MRQDNIERMKAALEELAAKGPKAPSAKKESAPKAKAKAKEEAKVEKEVVAAED